MILSVSHIIHFFKNTSFSSSDDKLKDPKFCRMSGSVTLCYVHSLSGPAVKNAWREIQRVDQKQTCRLLILRFVVIISPRAVLYLQMRNRDSFLTRPVCCGGTEGSRRRCGESVRHLRLWRTDVRDFPKHARLIFLLWHRWALPSVLKYRGFSL